MILQQIRQEKNDHDDDDEQQQQLDMKQRYFHILMQ